VASVAVTSSSSTPFSIATFRASATMKSAGRPRSEMKRMLSVAVHASGVSGTVRDGGTPATEVVLPSRRKARTVVRHRKLGASMTCHRV
jgi:hypothetical protein